MADEETPKVEAPNLQLVDGLDTGPQEVMPVVENKYLPKNLDVCGSDPLSVSPEAFAQLEHFYGSCLNSSKCPCESGKLYSECCKPMWQMARRAWKNKASAEKQAHKEAVREDMRDQAAEQKATKHHKVIAELFFNEKTGQTGVTLIANDQGQVPTYSFVANMLLEAYGKLILKMTAEQTQNIVGQMLQGLAQAQQGQGGQPGDMPFG